MRTQNIGTILTLLLFTLSSCCWRPVSEGYQDQYSYLQEKTLHPCHHIHPAPHYVVLLVDAPHLDYSNAKDLISTLSKHPSDGKKTSEVGHAWVYLKGEYQGESIIVEGGHSGETGALQPKYFEGVMTAVEAGDNNPISYLWEDQLDGFFQKGNGGHIPTYAIKIDLSEEQFKAIYDLIDPHHYDYTHYNITKNQCSTLVAEVAAIAGIPLNHQVTVQIKPVIHFGRVGLPMWRDPHYSQVTLSTPDILEKSMIEAVNDGKATPALKWYRYHNKKDLSKKIKSGWETCLKFPTRFQRYWALR